MRVCSVFRVNGWTYLGRSFVLAFILFNTSLSAPTFVSPLSAPTFVSPIDNPQVTQHYAAYGLVVSGAYHTGMDIVQRGTDRYAYTTLVKAAGHGIIHKIFGININGNNLRRWNPTNNTYTWEPAPTPGSNHGLGICVIIYHPDLQLYTLYGHLDAVVAGLTVGQSVAAGQPIGRMGNSHQQFLRRCPVGITCPVPSDAPPGTVTSDAHGFSPHLHFEVKDRGVLSAGRWDDCDPVAGCYWGYIPGPDPSTPNMPGHPNWFGYHDPNIFLNLQVQKLPEPVPVEVTATPLNVRDYPSTGSNSLIITRIASRSDGRLPAFVAIRSVGSEWYQIHLPNAAAEGWSAAGWVAGSIAVIKPTLSQIEVIPESARVYAQPSSTSSTLVFVYGGQLINRQRFVVFESTPGWHRIYLPEKSSQPDGWIRASDVQLIHPLTVTMTVTKNVAQGGTVTSSPAGINCGTGCSTQSASFPAGTVVTLTATAASGWQFSGWSGCDSVSGNQCTVTMNQNRTVTANFTQVSAATCNGRSLTFAGWISPSGNWQTVSGSVTTSQGLYYEFSLAGSSALAFSMCPSDGGSANYDTWLCLFDGNWQLITENDDFCGLQSRIERFLSAGTYRIAVSGYGSSTGNFTMAYRSSTGYTLTVTKNVAQGGTVTSSPAGINCGTGCSTQSASFPAGTVVTLTATAASGWQFSGWSGCDSVSGTQCTVTMNQNRTVTANFRQAIAPANDNFANAQVISGNSGTVTGSNVGATKEPGEPNHAGNAGGASVWYRWTPSISGSVTIDTIGSNFDTLLAVYTGSAVDSLTLIASNDDIGGGNLQSRMTFPATAGTTYHIAVDGYGGDTGNITLNWSLKMQVFLPLVMRGTDPW